MLGDIIFAIKLFFFQHFKCSHEYKFQSGRDIVCDYYVCKHCQKIAPTLLSHSGHYKVDK